MTVRFLSVAEEELAEAIEYYNQEKQGLGVEFAVEIDATISRIIDFPKAWPVISQRVRRCRTRRFPYGVLYQLRGEEILVVAIMDFRRDPKSWRNRL